MAVQQQFEELNLRADVGIIDMAWREKEDERSGSRACWRSAMASSMSWTMSSARSSNLNEQQTSLISQRMNMHITQKLPRPAASTPAHASG